MPLLQVASARLLIAGKYEGAGLSRCRERERERESWVLAIGMTYSGVANGRDLAARWESRLLGRLRPAFLCCECGRFALSLVFLFTPASLWLFFVSWAFVEGRYVKRLLENSVPDI